MNSKIYVIFWGSKTAASRVLAQGDLGCVSMHITIQIPIYTHKHCESV